MYDSTYAKYLDDIRNAKRLSHEEMLVMFKQYRKTKSKTIRDQLVASNMRFVLQVALNYKNSSVSMSDLLSEGAIGLMHAIERFDYTLGQKFITYAVYWIKSYINTAMNKHKNMIHIPANRVIQVSKALQSSSDGSALDKEAEAIMQINSAKVSLDAKIGDDSKNTFADILSNSKDDIKLESDVSSLVEGLTACLPEKEKHVLCESYGINTDKPHTLREIGSSMGYSHARIRQLRDQALRRIRKYTDADMLQAAKETVVD